MKSLRAAWVGIALAIAVGCGGRDSSPPTPTATGEGAESAAGGQDAGQQSARQSRPGRSPDLAPSWPGGWRVLDSGQAGGGASPVFTWFHLAAGDAPPDEAAQRTLEALRPLAGPLSTSDFAASKTKGQVVGQFRGAKLSGVIEARSEKGATEVLVTVEAHP